MYGYSLTCKKKSSILIYGPQREQTTYLPSLHFLWFWHFFNFPIWHAQIFLCFQSTSDIESSLINRAYENLLILRHHHSFYRYKWLLQFSCLLPIWRAIHDFKYRERSSNLESSFHSRIIIQASIKLVIAYGEFVS